MWLDRRPRRPPERPLPACRATTSRHQRFFNTPVCAASMAAMAAASPLRMARIRGAAFDCAVAATGT